MVIRPAEGPASGDVKKDLVIAGKYVLVQALSKGGMGQVWLARHKVGVGTEGPVAIKFPLAAQLCDRRSMTDFFREGELLMLLQSPNIPKVTDIGIHEGLPYLVMDFLPGVSLLKLCEKQWGDRRSLSFDLVAHIGREVAHALHDAHTFEVEGKPQQILHRDVASKNVFITGVGGVYLLDFGVATAVGSTSSRNVIKGTLLYMAPEHYGGRASPQSDAWGLGTILWELCEGRVFRSELSGKDDLMVRVAEGYAPPLTREGVPAALRRVVEGLLSPNDGERMTIAAAILALEDICGSRRWALSELLKNEFGRTVTRSGKTFLEFTWSTDLGDALAVAKAVHERGHVVFAPPVAPDAFRQAGAPVVAQASPTRPAAPMARSQADHETPLQRASNGTATSSTPAPTADLGPPPQVSSSMAVPGRGAPPEGRHAEEVGSPPRGSVAAPTLGTLSTTRDGGEPNVSMSVEAPPLPVREGEARDRPATTARIDPTVPAPPKVGTEVLDLPIAPGDGVPVKIDRRAMPMLHESPPSGLPRPSSRGTADWSVIAPDHQSSRPEGTRDWMVSADDDVDDASHEVGHPGVRDREPVVPRPSIARTIPSPAALAQPELPMAGPAAQPQPITSPGSPHPARGRAIPWWVVFSAALVVGVGVAIVLFAALPSTRTSPTDAPLPSASEVPTDPRPPTVEADAAPATPDPPAIEDAEGIEAPSDPESTEGPAEPSADTMPSSEPSLTPADPTPAVEDDRPSPKPRTVERRAAPKEPALPRVAVTFRLGIGVSWAQAKIGTKIVTLTPGKEPRAVVPAGHRPLRWRIDPEGDWEGPSTIDLAAGLDYIVAVRRGEPNVTHQPAEGQP